jgi:hypothetical protein
VPLVNHDQNLPGETGKWINVRVRADDPVLNRDRMHIPPVRDYIPTRDPGKWVRARMRAQNPEINRGRARALTPMPARPQNDENMEPEGPQSHWSLVGDRFLRMVAVQQRHPLCMCLLLVL